MKNVEGYLIEIQQSVPQLIIDKDNKNAPIFKWRNLLYRDITEKFCDKNPCGLVSYSLVDDNKKLRWKKDTTCVGGMILIENPDPDKTLGYKVNVMIVFLFIEDAYRNLKLGSMMLKKAIKKYKKIYLSTDKRSSDVAKSMYSKYGFKSVKKEGNIEHWVYI